MRYLKHVIFIGSLLLSFSCFGLDKTLAAPPLESLTVLLDWFPNPDHAPLFVAQQQGFFRQQGLEVKLIGPADPYDPPKLVAAKKADIAIAQQSQLLLDIEAGLPLIRIATSVDQPLNCVVVRADSKIKTISDLKGKRVGYSGGAADSMILKVMLAKNNLTLKDVEWINVHYNLTQSLLTNSLDAVVGMVRNFELIQMELQHQPGRAFYPEHYGIPSYDEFIFVARNDRVTDPRLRRFVIALQQGMQYLQAHPKESWERFAATHPESNNELNRRSWFVTLKYFAKEPAKVDAERYKKFAVFMQQQGLIKQVPALENYAINLLSP